MALFLAFDRCCAYCWQPIEGQPDPDHVIPLSRGGHNTISNVLPVCRPCNTDKRNLTPAEWAADRRQRGKPPRVTEWHSDPRYFHLALRSALPLAS
jgi:5-methylcytosine-specific restriction endonuclease McrA